MDGDNGMMTGRRSEENVEERMGNSSNTESGLRRDESLSRLHDQLDPFGQPTRKALLI